MLTEFVENERDQELICFCCDEVIRYNGTLDSATVWSSSGNYGSSLLDLGFSPEDPHHVELYVCDDCLAEKVNKVYSVYVWKTRPKYRYEKGYDIGDTKYKRKDD